MLHSRWIDKMLRKLSPGQGRPSKKMHFWSCDISDRLKYHRSIFRKISQGYCIHMPKYEKNPPYGCVAIAKRKFGSGSRFSHTQTIIFFNYFNFL